MSIPVSPSHDPDLPVPPFSDPPPVEEPPPERLPDEEPLPNPDEHPEKPIRTPPKPFQLRKIIAHAQR